MTAREKSFERALRFVQKKHRGQTRAGGMPAWHHLLRVSHILEIVLGRTKEGTINDRFTIPLAALGHDLLEDTKTKEIEIVENFTRRGLELIKGMTNPHGDSNHGPYIRLMAHAEEAVRLIKLADLYDNFTGITYNLALLGPQWTRSFFLPIVKPMHKTIVKTRFSTYKKSADQLIALVDTAAEMLDNELRYDEKRKNHRRNYPY